MNCLGNKDNVNITEDSKNETHQQNITLSDTRVMKLTNEVPKYVTDMDELVAKNFSTDFP